MTTTQEFVLRRPLLRRSPGVLPTSTGPRLALAALTLLVFVCALAATPDSPAARAVGRPLLELLLSPLVLAGVVPPASAVAVLALLLKAAAATAVLYRLLLPVLAGGAPPVETAAARLRRRFVAGALTHDAYQRAMYQLLRERYVRGELSLAEYDAELRRLLALARRLHALEGVDVAHADAPPPA